MSNPYVVNVSSIQDFMQCRFRWVCKWVENRVPLAEARALRFGKMYHKIMEAHQGDGIPMNTVLVNVRDEWKEKIKSLTPDMPDWSAGREALDDLHQLWEPILLWKDRYQFDIPVLAIEQPFRMPHPDDPTIELIGRPDRESLYQNRVYHVQNRSLGAGVNFPLYVELSKRSYHEHVYGHYLAEKWFNYKYGGTFFNLYRKLKYRKKPTKKQLEAAEAAGAPFETAGDILHPVSELFWQHPMGLDLDSDVHQHVMKCVLEYAREMRATADRYRSSGVIPPPNERLNGGPFGNKLDEYYRVLTGEITLDDPLYFKDREDTYAVVEES